MALKLNKFKKLFVVTEDIEEKKDDNKNQTIEKKNEENKVKNVTIQPENNSESSKMSWKTSANSSENNEIKNEVENNSEEVVNQTGEFSQKIFEQLSQAITDSNLPGEDYIEFMEALAAMKNLQLDENVKIQTVFATLSTKGLSKEKVIESADYYLKVLENEKTKFYEVLNGHMKTQIKSKLDEITHLENSINEKENQISTLQEEIKQTKQVVLKIKNDIQQSDNKIKKTENDFQITYDKIANSIKNKIEKIKSI